MIMKNLILNNWAIKWHMKFNVDKQKFMHICKNITDSSWNTGSDLNQLSGWNIYLG